MWADPILLYAWKDKNNEIKLISVEVRYIVNKSENTQEYARSLMEKNVYDILRQIHRWMPKPLHHQSRANDGRTTGGKHDSDPFGNINIQPQVIIYKITRPLGAQKLNWQEPK